MKKTCSKCQTPKPLDAFSAHSRGVYGLHPYCKECFAAYMRERRHRLKQEAVKNAQASK